jgi:hypothetical protein
MKNKKIPWIAVTVLLLVLVIVVAVIARPGNNSGQAQLETPATGAVEHNTPGQTEDEVYDYYPLVTFLTHENSTSQRVTPGTLPEVPSGESGYDNLVFTGWNAPIKVITEDTTYEAIYEDINEKDNVFVINTVYTTESSAQLTMSLRGKVKLSVADLEIHYDPNVVRVEDILKADSSVQYNILPEKGCIKISVMLTENLESAMDCFQLKLSFVDPEASVAQLDITVEDAAYQVTAGNLADATTGTISGKLVRIS